MGDTSLLTPPDQNTRKPGRDPVAPVRPAINTVIKTSQAHASETPRDTLKRVGSDTIAQGIAEDTRKGQARARFVHDENGRVVANRTIDASAKQSAADYNGPDGMGTRLAKMSEGKTPEEKQALAGVAAEQTRIAKSKGIAPSEYFRDKNPDGTPITLADRVKGSGTVTSSVGAPKQWANQPGSDEAHKFAVSIRSGGDGNTVGRTVSRPAESPQTQMPSMPSTAQGRVDKIATSPYVSGPVTLTQKDGSKVVSNFGGKPKEFDQALARDNGWRQGYGFESPEKEAAYNAAMVAKNAPAPVAPVAPVEVASATAPTADPSHTISPLGQNYPTTPEQDAATVAGIRSSMDERAKLAAQPKAAPVAPVAPVVAQSPTPAADPVDSWGVKKSVRDAQDALENKRVEQVGNAVTGVVNAGAQLNPLPTIAKGFAAIPAAGRAVGETLADPNKIKDIAGSADKALVNTFFPSLKGQAATVRPHEAVQQLIQL